MQLIVVALGAGVLGWALVTSLDDWADWLMLVMSLVLIIGTAVAVSQRSYPTRKRTFVREYEPDDGAGR